MATSSAPSVTQASKQKKTRSSPVESTPKSDKKASRVEATSQKSVPRTSRTRNQDSEEEISNKSALKAASKGKKRAVLEVSSGSDEDEPVKAKKAKVSLSSSLNDCNIVVDAWLSHEDLHGGRGVRGVC